MLLLDSRVREINGISVFPDHADPEQWYYMPLSPHLSTVLDGALGVDVPQCQLVGFRGDAGGGGFFNFDCNLGASQRQIDDLAREIANGENLRNLPRIGPVPLIDGGVKLLMQGKQSGPGVAGGAGAGAGGAAGPEFVLKIDHNEKPALYGANQAAFSVRLDEGGFTMMEQCLDGEIMPVAVVYNLDFLGLRPAYAIRLRIDWDRVQEHMDESFSAGFMFMSTEIGSAVDELVDKRAIVLESDTFVPEGADTKGVIDRRDAALAQVRNMITDAFFTPSLPPWTPAQPSDFEKGMEVAAKAAVVATAVAAGGPVGLLAAASFSYKKTDYKRVDKKVLNVNFSERVTIKKSIYPQGHLAGMFKLLRDANLPRDRFVKHVDLSNDWFKKRRVSVVTRTDFKADGIAGINVRAQYGPQPQNALLTALAPSARFEWLSQLDAGVLRRDVQLSYEVAFENADRTERPVKLVSPPFVRDVENVDITPRELYTIAPVTVLADNFPWDRYTAVEVHLRYSDPAHAIQQQDLVRLTSDKPDQVWRMFILDPALTRYEYRIVFRAANNRDVERPWVSGDDSQITVRNPFPTRRVVQVVPSFPWAEVDQGFVDLRYEDAANNVLEEASFSFKQGDADESFSVDLQDPTRKTVYYRVSVSYKDGRFVELPESMTNDRRIVARADARGRRIITVRPPVNFAQRRLKKVSVELRFEDFIANLSFADAFVFESAVVQASFEYQYADEARDKYEYRTQTVFENGLEMSTDWTASDDTELVLRVA
jgi:hypothetical protein